MHRIYHSFCHRIFQKIIACGANSPVLNVGKMVRQVNGAVVMHGKDTLRSAKNATLML